MILDLMLSCCERNRIAGSTKLRTNFEAQEPLHITEKYPLELKVYVTSGWWAQYLPLLGCSTDRDRDDDLRESFDKSRKICPSYLFILVDLSYSLSVFKGSVFA